MKHLLHRHGRGFALALALVAAVGLSGCNDVDADGVPDGIEQTIGLDPSIADTDGDGTGDVDEDLDADGWADWLEHFLGTDPGDLGDPDPTDTDGDGATDFVEVAVGTDPDDWDTDDDQYSDLLEMLHGSDPLEAGDPGTPDVDGDGDDAEVELEYGTNPFDWDTDGDGFSDREERGWDIEAPLDVRYPWDLLDWDSDGLGTAAELHWGLEPNTWDMDGDGYRDGIEFTAGTDAADPDDHPAGPPPTTPDDADDDALSDADETVLGTDPNDWDTDGDGYSDGFETGQVYRSFAFRVVDSDPLDPALPRSVHGPFDPDGDTLYDAWEAIRGTDPNDPDSDDDGFTDGMEVHLMDSDPLDPNDP